MYMNTFYKYLINTSQSYKYVINTSLIVVKFRYFQQTRHKFHLVVSIKKGVNSCIRTQCVKSVRIRSYSGPNAGKCRPE